MSATRELTWPGSRSALDPIHDFCDLRRKTRPTDSSAKDDLLTAGRGGKPECVRAGFLTPRREFGPV